MASITVKSFLDGIADTLQDTSETETDRAVTESDLVDAYNKEQKLLCAKYPDACSISEALQLASGIDQHIPAKGIAILAVHMNMGDDGETPGTPVVRCDLAAMQASDRAWNQATATEEILNFIPDPVDPKKFFCYPPSDGNGFVLQEYSVAPDAVIWDEDGDWETEIVQVNDQYLDKLERRILSRVYRRDTDLPGNITREQMKTAEAKES